MFVFNAELPLHVGRYSLAIYPLSCRLDYTLHHAYLAVGTLAKDFHTVASVQGAMMLDYRIIEHV